MKKFNAKTKFRLGAAIILFLFCLMMAVLSYYHLEDMVTRAIYRETEIFVGTADATRTYVKDVLRPKVSSLLNADEFIPQAMSTSYVGREVMARLKQRFPEFHYKRAAINPINPVNLADEFELGMLNWFSRHRETSEWEGLIKKEKHSFYTRFRAIYAEAECLLCHGDPANAPRAMKELYGTRGGFGYKVGEVVAADTVYIPVDVTFSRIKETAWMVFLIVVTSLFSLLGLFYLLFNRTVVSELKGLLSTFRGIAAESDPDPSLAQPPPGDEIEQLKAAFEGVAVDLKETHDNLKASETKYRLLFESSQDAILIFDTDARVKDINPAGIKLFGFVDRREALDIETFSQLFWDARDAERFVSMVREKGSIQGIELPMVNRSGKKLAVMISATVRRDENLQYAGVDVMLRDITEKRRMEMYLARTEKLASIGELAAGVAHEINNPLGVIKCYTNLVDRDLPLVADAKKDMAVIRKHTEQCQSVVEALLNFARASEPKKAETDIRQLIEEVLAVLESQMRKDGISVNRQYPEDIPSVVADAHQIKQVLMNLLLNARQAMPGGGRIDIRIGVDKKSRMLAIAVADTGSGIAQKSLDRIFDPFFTTKETGEGTGLGLSVSYGIVKQHNGEIEFESTAGKGATFTVLLPLDR